MSRAPRRLTAMSRYDAGVEVALIAMLMTAGGAIVGYVAHSWFGADARRTRRVLRKTRVTPIAHLGDGKLACVVGRVEVDGDLLQSLMSRRSCVAFETVVQVFGNLDMTVPARVEVTRKMVPFFIVDDSGRARVDAAEAALANRAIMKSERFEERLIENGARVRVVGSVILDATMQPDSEHGFRDGAYKATITGTSKYPLLIDLED